jgi:hypothetical protein
MVGVAAVKMIGISQSSTIHTPDLGGVGTLPVTTETTLPSPTASSDVGTMVVAGVHLLASITQTLHQDWLVLVLAGLVASGELFAGMLGVI